MLAIITIGISSSGKSTWAQSMVDICGFTQIERDKLRKAYYFNKFDEEFTRGRWRWSWEDDITEIQFSEIKKSADNKLNIIISDTNLDNKSNNRLKTYLIELGYVVKFKIFNVPLESAIVLDSLRSQPVSEDFIRKQYAKFQNTTINVVDVMTTL